MNFVAALLLLTNLNNVQLLIHPDGNCDFAERLTSQQTTFFKNPHWPATYAPGTTCRWTFDCPMWYACRLRCLDVGLPQTDDCYMDKLLVSGSGSPQLESAQVFCGRSEINYRSVSSRLTLGLVASRLSPGGRFRCTITSEPWTQPWFISPCTPNPMANHKENSPKEEVLHKQKIITSARTDHRRLHLDFPHTGLIQSRTPYTEQEIEKNPHIKNFNHEHFYEKHVNANSSYANHLKADSKIAKNIKLEMFSSDVEGEIPYSDHRPTKPGSPYLDNIEDGSPRLLNPEIRIPHARAVQAGLPRADFDRVEHLTSQTDNIEAKISHVRHVKAESQQGKGSSPHLKLHLPYLENLEDEVPHTRNEQGRGSYLRHIQAKSHDNFDPHIKIDSIYLDNVEDEDTEAEAANVKVKSHVRRAKAASPIYESIKPSRNSDLKHVENVEDSASQVEEKVVKNPKLKHVKTGSPHAESFKARRKIHQVVDTPTKTQKLRSKTPRLRRIKSGLPYADNINPDSKLDLPYQDNVKEDIAVLQAEPGRPNPVKELPYDRRITQEKSNRKHKVVSQVKRPHAGKHRGLKHEKKSSRHLKHEIKRTPSQAKHLPAGLPRITHQRTLLPQAKRVQTQIKRVTNSPAVASHRSNRGRRDENQIYF